jgi:lipoprotein-releasing system permease protein
VLVRGVMPEEERAVTDIDRFLEIGSLEDLWPGSRHIMLGRAAAFALGVRVGDRLNLLVARIETHRVVPQIASFTVSGLFEAGLQDHDGNLALIHMADAANLKGLGERAEGLAVRLHDPMAAPRFRERSAAWLTGDLRYTDWTEEHRSHFRAIRIEKTMMTVILLSIVAVAAFNIVASLMMVVTDKEKDIAILRTCGLEPGRVARIFLVQGSLIGLVGTLVGTVLGLVLAFNVETIVPWLERTFNFQIMPGDVYYVTEIPAEIQALDVVMIAVLAFIMAVMATVYPSRRAAAVAPAEALRYE